MTEQEWLECTDPQKMLEFVKGKARDRQYRLLACACCRRIWNLLIHEASRAAVEVAERDADGLVFDQEQQDALTNVSRLLQTYQEGRVRHRDRQSLFVTMCAIGAATYAVCRPFPESPTYYALLAVDAAARAVHWQHTPAAAEFTTREEWFGVNRISENVGCCPTIRDLFGSPFSSVCVDSSWLTPTVTALAQAIYDDRAFDTMPVLGDALEESGCNNGDILAHCRKPRPHARGCWLLDLLLGKE